MAVLNAQVSSGSSNGVKKGIDENSKELAHDILQRGIYAHPKSSTIRELVSNAYDAVNERKMAVSILSGDSNVSDHFDVEKVDGIHHASGWSPEYFNVDHLSDDDNVYIFYEEGNKQDIIRIKDNGVGIGKDRMVGYFSLGWSSKRSMKGALGKWGLGNKSALSLGIDSYTVISVYNGKKFRFEVYLNDVHSTTPKFSNGNMNSYEEVSIDQPELQEDGREIMVPKKFKFYYEDTDEKNGLEIVITVGKHTKKEFFEAIEGQLMYIPNVIFQHKELSAYSYTTIDIAADILYQDKNVIISKNNVFDKPHILLGTGNGLINYGFVAFNELEIEPKSGAVGMILDINEVEITPSRESVVWNPKTRKAVLENYDKVVDTATKMINEDLSSETDYLSWLIKAAKIKSALVNPSSSRQSSALEHLAGIIDASTVNKIYYNHNGFKKLYTSETKLTCGEKTYIRSFTYDKYDRKVHRKKITNTNSLAAYKHIFMMDGASDKYKDRYIYENISNGSSFVCIKMMEGWDLERASNLIGNTAEFTKYDAIIVPESTMDAYLLEEANGSVFDDDEDSSVTSIDANKLAALRKKENKIVVHKPWRNGYSFVYSAYETKIVDIVSTWAQDDIVYIHSDGKELANMLGNNLPAEMMAGYQSYREPSFHGIKDKRFDLKPIQILFISKENVKHFQDIPNAKSISEFCITSYKNGHIEFSPHVKLMVTLHILQEKFKKLLGVPKASYNFDAFETMFGSVTIKFLGSMHNFKNTSHLTTLDPFFKACLDIQISIESDNISLLKDSKDFAEKYIPDAFCGSVDEIESVSVYYPEIVEDVSKNFEHIHPYRDLFNSGSIGVVKCVMDDIVKSNPKPYDINVVQYTGTELP